MSTLKTLVPVMGDLIRCWFPLDEQPDQAGPKFRPVCFLGETFLGGKRHFIVAYGTTKTDQEKEAKNGGDVYIRAADEHRVVLDEDTRIDFNRIKAVPATDMYFTKDHRGQPFRVSAIPQVNLKQAAAAMQCAGVHNTLRRLGMKV